MASSEANIGKGHAAIAEGEKSLNRTTIFGFGGGRKFEDAAEAFKKAGNFFKLGNDFNQAGLAYKRAADAYKQTDDKLEAVNTVVESANCFKKAGEVVKAIKMFENAISMYNDNGRLGMSARYLKEMAEIYESDHNTAAAAEAYKRAADMFNMDNKKSNANQCMQKVALFRSEQLDNEGLNEAGLIYEEVAKESLSSRLGAYSAKGYLFQALLCYVALGDVVQVTNKLNSFKDLDYSFSSSRECEFITKLLEAIEKFDMEAFETACADFDRITPLDPWKIKMLLKGKQPIIDATGGSGSDEVDLS